MKLVILIIATASLLNMEGCGFDYPTESDIALAWQTSQPEQASLFTSRDIKNLKCNKAGNRSVYCSYQMGEISHSDVLEQKASGQWVLLMLDKKDESDD